MQGDELEAYASRLIQSWPHDDEGEPLRCYLRIRVGRRQSHARTAASGIQLLTDPATLADDLRSRLEALRGDPDSPRAWVEALVKGEASPWDTTTISLEDGDGPDAPADGPPTTAASTIDKGVAWVLVRQADAIVRQSESAQRRAEAAETRAARLVERVAELRAERELAMLEHAGGGGGIAEAMAPLAPLALAVAARLSGLPAEAAPPPPPPPPEPEGEPDPDALAEEIEQILAELPQDQSARIRARLAGAA